MSTAFVSYEVWNNGVLAANRFDALVRRAPALCAELSEVAERWQKARDQYGEEFPAWSYGDSELPASVRNLLADSDLAERVEKVQNTPYDRIIRLAHGATADELKSVPRDVEKLEPAVRGLAERVAKAKGEYACRMTLAKMRQLRASLQAVSRLQTADTEAAVNSVQEEKAQREKRERHRYAEEVSRLLETLAAEVSSQDRTAIEQRAQETVELPASRRRALLTQLRLDVQRANEAGRARQRVVRQVEQWRERLLGLEGTEVEQLDAALRQVIDGEEPLPPDMAQKVEDAVARATEASNRAYALGVITEELENLGYVVEVGFETASAQAPEMLLHKPDMEEDYHVSLRAEAGGLHNRVVREASDPNERSADRERTDEQMERTWCQDFATALAASEPRGVRGRAVTRNPPGEVPVQTIAPLKGRSKRKSKSKRRRAGQLESRAGR